MAEDGPKDLEAYRISALPPSFYYIPNFLSNAESTYILSKIPPNRWTTLSHRRLQAHPSTLTKSNTLIAAPLPPWLTTYPPILERVEKLGVFEGTKRGAPNHVLVNEYKRGEGIMAHEDGAAYEHVVATVSLGGSLCLEVGEKASEERDAEEMRNVEGQGAEADGPGGKEERNGRQMGKFRILQEPGSLLVTRGEAYGSLLHGIAQIERDEDLGPATVVNWELLGDRERFACGVNERETRVSLTYRDVRKVSKVGIGVLGKR